MSGIQRVALVTGCAKQNGIGAGIVRALALLGVAVVAVDAVALGVANKIEAPASEEWRGLDSLVEEITRQGGRAVSATGDVSAEEGAAELVRFAVAEFGRLDILINNAGAPQGDEFNDIALVPLSAWERVMDINLRGTFLMTRAAVPEMRKNEWGRIINISSLAGRTGYAKQAAYSASKAGIIGMTRSVAKDVANQNITVNAICPGWIRTSRSYNSAARVANDVDAEFERRAKLVPVGRLGTAGDIGALVGFLSSEGASYLTGQIYDVDGGLLMA